MRNMLATLLLSQGTPMLLAGDEFGRTQQGNNNAYCQDNEISWVDWNLVEPGESLIRFVKKLTALRRHYPILRRSRFLSGEMNEELGIREITWINASGKQMEQEQWSDDAMLCFGMLLDGRAQAHRHPATRAGRNHTHHLQRLPRRRELHAARRR